MCPPPPDGGGDGRRRRDERFACVVGGGSEPCSVGAASGGASRRATITLLGLDSADGISIVSVVWDENATWPFTMQALTGHVTGRVQGVGFRWSTRHQAELLGLTGWVRNRMDGSVEVFAQGSPAALDAFRDYLAVGPRHADVTRVRLREAEVDPSLVSFVVR